MYQISWCVPFTVVATGPKQMKECIITSLQEMSGHTRSSQDTATRKKQETQNEGGNFLQGVSTKGHQRKED